MPNDDLQAIWDHIIEMNTRINDSQDLMDVAEWHPDYDIEQYTESTDCDTVPRMIDFD